MESPSFMDYLIFFLIRPLLAILFVVCFISLWWFLAWKLVLRHVPLVQEIFGLRKKTFKPKPESRGRISKFYKSCIGLFCPCYIFGKNAELLGSCLTHCISWSLVNTICCFATNGVLLGLPGCFVSCYACGYRRSLRTKYNLQEAPCGDFVTHFFCHLCAICQEYRHDDGYYQCPCSSNHGTS